MNIFENFPRCARRFVKNFSRKVDDMFNFCWGRCDRKWRFSNKETAFAKVQHFSNDLGRADISKLSAEAFICLKSIIDWFQTDEWTSGCPECLFAAWDGRKNGAGGGVGREEEWDGRRRVTEGGVGREEGWHWSIPAFEIVRKFFNENNFIKMSICEEFKSSHGQHSVSESFFRYLNV